MSRRDGKQAFSFSKNRNNAIMMSIFKTYCSGFMIRLPNLASIDLSGDKITDVGARALAHNSNLERVQLSGKLTRAAVAEFAKLTSIYINGSEL
jgi:hypothetical protein